MKIRAVAGVVLAVVVLSGCQHHDSAAPRLGASSRPGAAAGYVLGSGVSVLRFVPLATPSPLMVTAAQARAKVDQFARADSALYARGHLVSIGYGMVTSSYTGVDYAHKPAWVARYLVPFADIPPDSCPRLRPTPLPTPPLGAAAIIVNPTTGQTDTWNVDRREQCAP